MILITHAVVGTAAASIVYTNPIAAFILAFASHFAVDAIPHWHYPVRSFMKDPNNPMKNDMQFGKQFIFDAAIIGIDALLGLFLSYLFFHTLPFPIILLGTIGGILPDALQFVYWKWRHEPLTSLQRFHMWIHAETDLDHLHIVGVTAQIILMIAVSALVQVI